MRKHLLSWQLENYPANHVDRRNLAIHLATVPLFLAGTVLLVLGPFVWLWASAVGIAAMVLAMALQGRGHKGEQTAPAPFAGPGDVFLRIFAEQWITFPRFVLSGGFARAWRRASAAPRQA